MRPEIPEVYTVPTSYIALMKECWCVNPDDRPGFKEIAQRLLSIGLEDDVSLKSLQTDSTMTVLDRIEMGSARIPGLCAKEDAQIQEIIKID